MATYDFQHSKTGKIAYDVVIGMDEPKVYLGPKGTAKPGVWRRLWSKPTASIDTQCDPHSAADFIKVTNKGGKVGDMWERSAEMSAKRAEKEGGRDPIKQAFYDRFSKTHGGQKHQAQIKEEGRAVLKERGINIDFGD